MSPTAHIDMTDRYRVDADAYPMATVWTIDLDALTAWPDCDICEQQVCDNYSTCQGKLRDLVDRASSRALRTPDDERAGSRP